RTVSDATGPYWTVASLAADAERARLSPRPLLTFDGDVLVPGPINLAGDDRAVNAVQPDRLTGGRAPSARDEDVEVIRAHDARDERVVIVGVRHLRPVVLVGLGETAHLLDVAHRAHH